jgi:hypothetical protein
MQKKISNMQVQCCLQNLLFEVVQHRLKRQRAQQEILIW